jgi:peptidyl-prolyl cis-trans isomerase B (cyclophilin B)
MRRALLLLTVPLALAALLTAGPATTAAGCTKVSRPKPKPDGGQKRPSVKLDPHKTYEVTLITNCGSFTIRLDVKDSPHTTASFYTLTRNGFFKGTVFHRIIPGFVVQGGDPTASGLGGPGYSTVDKPPTSARYTLGVVAMAKAPAEAPGTSGSQFFVVTGADVGLDPDYALLGKIVRGLDVVTRIGKLGSQSGKPTAVVEIERAQTRSF